MGVFAIFKIVQVVGGAVVVALASAGVIDNELLAVLSVVFGVTATGTVVTHQLMEKQKETKINTLLLAVEPIVEHAPVEPIVKEDVKLFASEIKAQHPKQHHPRGPRKSPREIR